MAKEVKKHSSKWTSDYRPFNKSFQYGPEKVVVIAPSIYDAHILFLEFSAIY